MGRPAKRDVKRIKELQDRLRELTMEMISGKITRSQYYTYRKDLTSRITELKYGKN